MDENTNRCHNCKYWTGAPDESITAWLSEKIGQRFCEYKLPLPTPFWLDDMPNLTFAHEGGDCAAWEAAA